MRNKNGIIQRLVPDFSLPLDPFTQQRPVDEISLENWTNWKEFFNLGVFCIFIYWTNWKEFLSWYFCIFISWTNWKEFFNLGVFVFLHLPALGCASHEEMSVCGWKKTSPHTRAIVINRLLNAYIKTSFCLACDL